MARKRRPRYETDDDEKSYSAEIAQMGQVAFNDLTESRKRPRKVKEKQFPFGFQLPPK